MSCIPNQASVLYPELEAAIILVRYFRQTKDLDEGHRRSRHILYSATQNLFMSTCPVSVPASTVTSSGHKTRGYNALSALKGHTFGVDKYSARGTVHISIPHLREAIRTLDSKMASLMDQRHELESHLEQAVRLQSPVLRLPSELLSSIFVMGVLGMGDEDPVMVPTLMLVW